MVSRLIKELANEIEEAVDKEGINNVRVLYSLSYCDKYKNICEVRYSDKIINVLENECGSFNMYLLTFDGCTFFEPIDVFIEYENVVGIIINMIRNG